MFNKGAFKTLSSGLPDDLPLNSVNSRHSVDQCTVVCPCGRRLQEKDSTQEVWKALHDESKGFVIQTAPAIRAALGRRIRI